MLYLSLECRVQHFNRRHQDLPRLGQFDFEDFRDQLQKLQRLGSIQDILKMVPGMGQMAKQLDGQDLNSDLKQIEAIINSMTTQERRLPTVLNASRRRRIARGSGTTVEDVNQLIKRFRDMQKMMKQAGMLGDQRGTKKRRRRRRHREPDSEGILASLRQGRLS